MDANDCRDRIPAAQSRNISHSIIPVVFCFTFVVQSWYVLVMERGYIGIITHRGLEGLYLETEHVVRFLDRRVYGRRPYLGCCYWAVLDTDIARRIQWQIEQASFQEALSSLQLNSTHYGPIMPSDDRRQIRNLN